jgi:hypothetical protein
MSLADSETLTVVTDPVGTPAVTGCYPSSR